MSTDTTVTPLRQRMIEDMTALRVRSSPRSRPPDHRAFVGTGCDAAEAAIRAMRFIPQYTHNWWQHGTLSAPTTFNQKIAHQSWVKALVVLLVKSAS